MVARLQLIAASETAMDTSKQDYQCSVHAKEIPYY